MTQTPANTVRARARAEMTEQIKQIARAHLARTGSDLSLRAVARELGVVSSAVYRYFASRDELLTALIVDGYHSLGDAAERAEASIARGDLSGRWLAFGRGVRGWALSSPHVYALLYGSPVPGYTAPQDTIAPAARVVLVLAALLRDGVERGELTTVGERLPRAVRADLQRIGAAEGFTAIPAPVLARGLSAWAQLLGTLSLELYGHLHNGITDYDAYFDYQLRVMGRQLGLGPGAGTQARGAH